MAVVVAISISQPHKYLCLYISLIYNNNSIFLLFRFFSLFIRTYNGCDRPVTMSAVSSSSSRSLHPLARFITTNENMISLWMLMLMMMMMTMMAKNAKIKRFLKDWFKG